MNILLESPFVNKVYIGTCKSPLSIANWLVLFNSWHVSNQEIVAGKSFTKFIFVVFSSTGIDEAQNLVDTLLLLYDSEIANEIEVVHFDDLNMASVFTADTLYVFLEPTNLWLNVSKLYYLCSKSSFVCLFNNMSPVESEFVLSCDDGTTFMFDNVPAKTSSSNSG